MKFKKVLVTGAAGFIGSNLFDYLVEQGVAEKYVSIDAAKTGSNFSWLDKHQDNENIMILKGDLSSGPLYNRLKMLGHGDIDGIFHLAAESHVDRSISNGVPFGMSNMMGTMRLLEFCRDLPDLKMFLNFCTDEVMGSRTEAQGAFHPYERKMVRNVYSATKSAQEELGFGYSITHGIPVITTRCTNVYGPRQYPEKFMPVIITKLMKGEKIPVYGDGMNEREWVYVSDVVSSTLKVVDYIMDPEQSFSPADAHYNIFHIGGMKTYPNLDLLKMVIRELSFQSNGAKFEEGAEMLEYFDFIEDRKGHDFRYDLDCTGTHQFGCAPTVSLEDGIKKTVEWYLEFFRTHPKGW